MTDPIEIKKVEEGIRIGDTILSQITDTGKVEGNNNVFIQGINNSDVTVRIEIPQTIFDLYFDLICEFIDKSSKSSFYGGTHYHYSRTEDDDYQKIRQKIETNRGIGTSEILKDKTVKDLDKKTITEFFAKENVRREIARQDQNIEILTEKEMLYYLSLVENGHIFKGSFLCFARFNLISSVCDTAMETKFNIFKGTERDHILINDTIKGNILKQFEEALIKLQAYIPLIRNVYTSSDSFEIPFIAFKEIVANAYVHRSYEPQIRSYIQIELFDDRLEVKSPGQFPEGLDLDHIEVSQIINPTVAAVFHLSGHIEKSGTGINRAQKAMRDAGLRKIVFSQDDKQKFVKAILYRPGKTVDTIEKVDDGIKIGNFTLKEILSVLTLSGDTSVVIQGLDLAGMPVNVQLEGKVLEKFARETNVFDKGFPVRFD